MDCAAQARPPAEVPRHSSEILGHNEPPDPRGQRLDVSSAAGFISLPRVKAQLLVAKDGALLQ